jgi:transposase
MFGARLCAGSVDAICNDELIGPFPGIIVSDGWPGYEHLDPHQQQVSWSRLQRDFRRHSEWLVEQKTFGEHGLTDRMFAAWRAYQHEHQDRARLQADVTRIQTDLRTLLEDAGRKSKRTRLHRRFASNLLKVWPALWTFTTQPAVKPTNPAERALRGPVTFVQRLCRCGCPRADCACGIAHKQAR